MEGRFVAARIWVSLCRHAPRYGYPAKRVHTSSLHIVLPSQNDRCRASAGHYRLCEVPSIVRELGFRAADSMLQHFRRGVDVNANQPDSRGKVMLVRKIVPEK